jgi:hypothetical protein
MRILLRPSCREAGEGFDALDCADEVALDGAGGGGGIAAGVARQRVDGPLDQALVGEEIASGSADETSIELEHQRATTASNTAYI